MEKRLSIQFLRHHPQAAANLLASLPARQLQSLFAAMAAADLAATVASMDPYITANTIAALPDQNAHDLLSTLEITATTRILRALERDDRRRLLALLPARLKTTHERQLRLPRDCVGAWADARFVQFNTAHSVRQASQLILQNAKQAVDVLVVCDDNQRFAGYVHAVELLRHGKDARLQALLTGKNAALPARLNIIDAGDHPFWATQPLMVVIDESQKPLGILSRAQLEKTLKKHTIFLQKPTPVDALGLFGFYLSILSRTAELFFDILDSRSSAKSSTGKKETS